MSLENYITAESSGQTSCGQVLRMSWHGASHRAEMMRLWSDLQGRGIPLGPMATATWVECWLDHYGATVPHWFVTASDEQGAVVGVCLITEGIGQRNGPFAVRSLHVGTAGEPEQDSVVVEHNNWPVLPQWRAAFVRTLQEEIDQRKGWEEWNLDGFAPDRAFNLMWPAFSERSVVCCYFDLNKTRVDGQQVLDRIGFATRKTIKNNLKTFKDLQIEWVSENVDHALDIFHELVALHQARWQAEGLPGSYSSQVFTAFHTALIHRFLPEGRMVLFRVRDGQQTIGCSQLLINGDHVMVYQGGRSNLAGKFSPGLVTDYLCIEEAFQRGFNIYDFLGGDTLHKRRLTTDTTRLVWRTWRRPSAKFFVLDCGRGVNAIRRATGNLITQVATASCERTRQLALTLLGTVQIGQKEKAR